MEVASDDEPKRSYSWWWDSHISPKNSKWLQDNLSDMDNKIKAMIKLIEEDADSFARRAEMYYKKRPDLMKLVEEFYRAYRALAERYDHVTGALRQAHTTIAVAFPNQTPLLSPDEPPSGSPGTGDEDSYDSCMPMRSNGIQWDGEETLDEETHKTFGGSFLRKSSNLKEDDEKVEEEVSELTLQNQNIRKQINLESLRADKAEAELQRLKDSLSTLISKLESEISKIQGKFRHLDDEIRIKVSELGIAKQRCLGMEGENASLKLELDKLNLVVSKQNEEALDLLEENQNLHNQVDSESKRAGRAEAESSKFSEAILKLKVEMEHALLQYNVSQGRISDLEAEISRTEEEFKKICDEKLMGASKLNMVEDQCLLLQEEKKSLRRELDKFMQKMTKQEEEIIMREEELYKLEQRVERQEEEILVGERELTKLERRLEDECKQRLRAESAHKALVELHSQSQENVRHLAAEIRLGTGKLRKMELRKACLEDEIKLLRDENNGLNEENFSSVSKIMCLQDEIISLRFNGVEGLYGLMEKFRRMEQREAGLEEELRHLYGENNGLNEKKFSFSSKIVNLKDEIISLRESKCRLEDELLFHVEEKKLLKQELFSLKNERNVLEQRHRELIEQIEEVNFNGNKELKETLNKHEDEKTGHLEQLGLLKSISGYNAFLDDYLSVPISHIEAVNQSMEKLTEKNEVLENSIFDLNVEFGVLRGEVKALDESCESLCYQKSFLVAQNSNLVSQVERVALHQQRLENRFAALAGKNVNVEEEDLMEELLSQSITSFNQINIEKKQIHFTKQELEEEHSKILEIEIENFLMKQFLVELTEKNLFLSKECGKYMDKLKHAENLFFELKQEWVPQEKKLITLSDRNVKLLEGIHVMMKAYDATNVCESDGTKDSELRAQNKGFEPESMLRNQEIFNLRRKNNELMEINKQREEMLNVEMERMLGMLSDLQESRHLSQSEISKLLEENESLSKKLYDAREKNDALEEENDDILGKLIFHEHLSLIFRLCITDKSSDIQWLSGEVNYLYRITNDLGEEIGAINRSMRALEAENMLLKEEHRSYIVLFENKIQQARNALKKLDMETEMGRSIMELEKNLFSLLEENSCKYYEIARLLKPDEISEDEFYEFREPETNLSSELQISSEECRFYKAEAMELLQDLHVSSFMELIFKEKFFELMQKCSRNVQEEDLKEKVDVLRRENEGLKAELNAYAPLVASLENEIASLEERTLSLTNLHILKSKRKQGNILASLQPKNSSQVRGKHHSLRSPRASAGILELKKLRAKVKVLQKAVADTEALLDQEVVSGANIDGETRKIKAWKLNERARLVGTQKKKDIILDLFKSKEGIGADVKPSKYGVSSGAKHDRTTKDIETNDNTDKLWDPTTLNIIDNYQIIKMELERSETLGLPSDYDEPLREWIDRVNGFLSTDAQRLLDLENILKELKKKTETSEMKSQPSASELDTVKLQVKEAEKALMQLIDFNCKLTKMVETVSLSSDSNKLRSKVLERVQRGAEKIDRLELKLQKVQCTLLELQEEELGSKAAKASERRYRIPLKDLIYGKRSDSRKMKHQFCACMRFKTKEK